ncbi:MULTISPECIES: DUF938 domain-containing protein [Lysobacter]|jgi:SAM-dependent methyltransferase|uniref:DUF938 domain-containing protein n=1 Tax=Lysobacter TaxID=68 RepID=UPI001F3407A3|nr:MULTISPECIES: DUF938 domain-containing protein [Lysobacter]UJB19336.1 class I SAM-dependent methyltransferase [Lysobacter capsici]UJQ26939.1 class I SAM-dependent methyltransferase [Lysobacter gummosus]
MKPYSPSCERNREPILAVLRERFADRRTVLEIGSGTGQHAVHFAAAMPWLSWQCADRAEYLPGIGLWLEEAALANTPPPLELEAVAAPVAGFMPAPVSAADASGFDAAFSANTLHIMGWPQVEGFFAGLDAALAPGATVVVYGPFNYGGRFSSDSNREFDAWLKARDPVSGVRDFEAVDALAAGIGLRLIEDVAMPANNRCLVWRRGA